MRNGLSRGFHSEAPEHTYTHTHPTSLLPDRQGIRPCGASLVACLSHLVDEMTSDVRAYGRSSITIIALIPHLLVSSSLH